MGKTWGGGIVLGLALASAAAAAQVTIVGTNSFPNDVNNVQAAVMTPNARVRLSGQFNFGTTGQVVFSVPGVTLEGAAGGATIKGGFFPLTTVPMPDGSAPSGAKNLMIRNLRFEGWQGYAIYHRGVQAEDNVTRIEGNTFINTRWPEADDSYGIHYCSGSGKAIIRGNRLVGISLFAISTHDLTLHPNDRVIIEANQIEDAHLDPVVVEVHNPLAGDVDNGPVIIRNNRIQISSDTPNPYVWGISLGTFYFNCALNNAVVEGNVITGRVCDGIFAFPYGRDRKIMNNDLSGMTSFEGQITAQGRKDLIAGNKLGPVDTTGVLGNSVSWGIGLIGLDWSAWYPPGLGPDPDPVKGSFLLGNDFRLTGLEGWAVDAAKNITSIGCVLLLSGVDLGWCDWWPGCEVTDNLVCEVGRFPAGTGGPARQVLEYPIYAHDNRIAGLASGGYSRSEAGISGLDRTIGRTGPKFAEGIARKRALAAKSEPQRRDR